MVEHIVHIDGVTGSSPVATTRRPSATWLRALFISRRPGGKGGGSLAWPSRAYFVGLLWPRALGNSVVEPGFMPGAFFSFRRTRGLAGPPEGRKTAAADKPRGLPGMRRPAGGPGRNRRWAGAASFVPFLPRAVQAVQAQQAAQVPVRRLRAKALEP